MTTADPMMSDPSAAVAAPADGRGAAWRATLHRWWSEERVAVVMSCGLLLIVALAAVAPLLPLADPIEQSISERLQSPSSAHWLGTDDVGRDVLSRLVYGARYSLAASALAVSVALVVGVPIGLVSGFFGGKLDNALMRVIDTILAFPALVLAIGITGALGPNLFNSMAAVGVVFAPSIARITRGQTMAVRSELFVSSARSYGTGRWRLLTRHILPNSLQPVIVQASLLLAVGLLAEASLSFLGLGVQPPDPSWGSMLGRAYSTLSIAPGQMYAPGLMIVVCALAFNQIGDAARRQLDPRQRR